MQAIKIVIWRDGVPLYPEEAEIEDASKINIDWLIDMKEPDIENKDNKSIAMNDVSITLFGHHSFFSTMATKFSQKDDIMGYEHQLVVLVDSDELTNTKTHTYNSQENTTNTEAQGSQGIGRHDKPLVLT